MSRMIGISEAHEITGLSKHELRTGAISGKYPRIRAGGSKGKILFDIQLLQEHIRKLMQQSTMREETNINCYGTLRKIL